MSWKYVKLGDIISVEKGDYITKKDANVGPYPVILGGREPAYFINKFNHTGKAIVISRSGASAGYVSKWNEPIFITDGFLIEPKLFVDYDFVYYSLKNNEALLQSMQKGAAIPHVTPTLICSAEIALPPLETQQRIASILSAYDDLIDNNRRQIKLLEEAAQRLYKEWFVDLRFPGHENVKVVDGVPEGWRVGTLSEIAEFKRGKTITKAQVVNGDVPVVAGGLEPAYYHDKPNTTAPVITISGSGANAGFTRMYLENIFASDCSFVDIKGTQYLYFIFCYLQAHNVELTALQKGSAQPHVYAKDINSMKLTVPDAEILQQFCVYAGKFFDLIGKRERQKKFLSEARDRLLPKLISGEIEV